jgi:membrane-bound inhibitor of C-type lysozyme
MGFWRGMSALVLVSALGACAPVLSPAVAYACEGGVRMALRFAPERAFLSGPDGATVELAQQLSASGFRYAGAGHAIQGKGRSLDWTVGAAAPLTCLALGR